MRIDIDNHVVCWNVAEMLWMDPRCSVSATDVTVRSKRNENPAAFFGRAG